MNMKLSHGCESIYAALLV